MSNFEIFLIVGCFVAPLLAILFVLPKKAKKEKKKEVKEVKTLEEVKKEEKPQSVVEEKKPENKTISKSEISTDDFKSYLELKKKDITKPSRIELPKDFIDRTTPYIPRRRRRNEKKPQTVAEEINSLSPKVKAMLLSGVLDRKFFDN